MTPSEGLIPSAVVLTLKTAIVSHPYLTDSDAEVRPVANLILNTENAPLRSWVKPP